MSTIDILLQYRAGFLSGLSVTIRLALFVWVVGLFVGATLGVLAVKFRRTIGALTRTLSFILSGIPVLVFLFWAHYPLQVMFRAVIDPFYTAAGVLAVINTFAVADLISSHLRDFPEQYVVAARVCGLSTRTTVLKIQLPIILRQVIPALLPLQVAMLHATLFASLISVEEIFRMSQRINSVVYKPIEIYSALAILFLVTCLPVNGLALWLRARFTRNISEV